MTTVKPTDSEVFRALARDCMEAAGHDPSKATPLMLEKLLDRPDLARQVVLQFLDENRDIPELAQLLLSLRRLAPIRH